MSEAEDIGRFHQLSDALTAALRERNDRLRRAGIILAAAADPPLNRQNAARRCNFDSAQRLLDEARERHQAALLLIEELRQAAPAAGKTVPGLE